MIKRVPTLYNDSPYLPSLIIKVLLWYHISNIQCFREISQITQVQVHFFELIAGIPREVKLIKVEVLNEMRDLKVLTQGVMEHFQDQRGKIGDGFELFRHF